MDQAIEALKKISDSNLEILVAAYLRRHEHKLKRLIATGINENGEPIPCPVDNILFVSGTPPTCYSVATTKIDRPKLRNKWLGKNQDFDKADHEFAGYKKQNSDTKCVLYLATKHFLKSDTKLYKDVVTAGEKNNIEVRVIEASTLVDFLYIDPDGQYIGHILLGIEPHRLSYDLLKIIAKDSLNQHQNRFPLQQSTDVAIEIRRDIQEDVLPDFSYSSPPLIGLRGASGTGKSTLLRQIGRKVNENDGIALWIPADDISPNTPLDYIIFDLLKRYRPGLLAQTIDEFNRLINELPQGVLLLVDDINRAENPERTLAGLNAFGNEIKNRQKPIRVIVPMWPGQLAPIPDQQFNIKNWTFIELETFSDSEREQFSQALQNQNARTLIDALHGDPFLAGLATFYGGSSFAHTPYQLLNQIFKDTLQATFREAQHHLSSWVSTQDFDDALNALAAHFLQIENPEPLWGDIQNSIGEKQIQLLIALAHINRIGWIDQREGKDYWRWKHNRLRDIILGKWLAENIFPHLLVEASEETRKWLSDPGLAEAFALALAFTSSEYDPILKTVGEYQPLILAEVLRLNLFPTQSGLRNIIAEQLKKALEDEDLPLEDFVNPPRNLLLYTLTFVTDPLVLDVTSRLKGNWHINWARFRNGDLDAGEVLISKHYSEDFPAHMNFPFLETVIREFASQREHKRHTTTIELANKIQDSKSAITVLYIASIIQWPELLDILWQAWNQLPQDEKAFSAAAMVWFLSNFDVESILPKLESAFLISLKLSDEEQEKGHAPERYWRFTDPLRLTLWRPVSKVAAVAWAKIITSNEKLWENTGYLLGGIDHPETLEAYIQWQGKRKWFSPWDETGESIDPLAKNQLQHSIPIPIKPESRQHVWKIFVQGQVEDIRRQAFYMWRRSANQSDLPTLQKINADDPLFDIVLQLRLKLRDKTATPYLIQNMSENPAHWSRFAPLLIDEPSVFEVLDANLESALNSTSDWGYSDDLFKHLPHQYLKKLVRNHRNTLLAHRRTWPSLWISNELSALELVQEGIRQSSSDELRHFFLRSHSGPITSAMLKTLEPVLTKFTSDDLKVLGWGLVRQKKIDWLQKHLPNIIADTNSRTFAWLTHEDIISTLDEASELVSLGWKTVDRESSLRSLEISIEHGNEYVADIVKSVRIWLNKGVATNKLIISARVISKFGNSEDIPWWIKQEPADSLAKRYWEDALFHLKRRRWQAT